MRNAMAANITVSDIGRILELMIISVRDYVYRRRAATAIAFLIMRGGIAIMTLGIIQEIILRELYGDDIDRIVFGTGVVLILLALAVYYIDRNAQKVDRPDIDIDPPASSSHFRVERRMGDDRDPKWIDDRGFELKVVAQMIAGHRDIRLHSVDITAYNQGMALMGTTKRFWIDGKEIEHCEDGCDPPGEACYDGQYEFQPSLLIEPSVQRPFWIERIFHPEEGRAPVDYKNVEVEIALSYSARGERRRTVSFYFKTHYETNGLVQIPKISDIPFLSDRELWFLLREERVSREDFELVRGIPAASRVRLIWNKDRREDEIQWTKGVTMRSLSALDRAFAAHLVEPIYDPDAVWETQAGRAARWIARFLTARMHSRREMPQA